MRSVISKLKSALGGEREKSPVAYEASGLRFVRVAQSPWRMAACADWLPQVVSQILTYADARGGYVAGGFARNLFLFVNGERGRARDVAAYLGLNGNHPAGDIDVFFESREVFDDCVSCAKSVTKDLVVERRESDGYGGMSRIPPLLALHESPAYTSLEIVSRGVKMQMICAAFGTPEEVMSGFTVVNSRFAFDSKHVVYAEAALAAEKSGTLHVDRWKDESPFSIRYVAKYQQRWSYDSARVDDETGIAGRAMEIVARLKESPVLLSNGGEYTAAEVVRTLFHLKRFLSNEDLVRVAALGSPASWATEELFRRSPACSSFSAAGNRGGPRGV